MNHSFILTDVPGQGLGVYAARPFQAGEYVLAFGGQMIPLPEIADFTHYIQVTPLHFFGPSGEIDDYINHSCDPNCGLYLEGNDLVVRALREIKPLEQITFDYSTNMFAEPTSFDCCCGAEQCRGRVGNFFLLPEEHKQSFLMLGIVPLLTRYSEEELLALAPAGVFVRP